MQTTGDRHINPRKVNSTGLTQFNMQKIRMHCSRQPLFLATHYRTAHCSATSGLMCMRDRVERKKEKKHFICTQSLHLHARPRAPFVWVEEGKEKKTFCFVRFFVNKNNSRFVFYQHIGASQSNMDAISKYHLPVYSSVRTHMATWFAMHLPHVVSPVFQAFHMSEWIGRFLVYMYWLNTLFLQREKEDRNWLRRYGILWSIRTNVCGEFFSCTVTNTLSSAKTKMDAVFRLVFSSHFFFSLLYTYIYTHVAIFVLRHCTSVVMRIRFVYILFSRLNLHSNKRLKQTTQPTCQQGTEKKKKHIGAYFTIIVYRCGEKEKTII